MNTGKFAIKNRSICARGGGIGPSGAGSYNRLAEFKAEILNNFVEQNNIQSVIEWGCGDGNQLSYAKYPKYIGLDVSPTILELNREKFQKDNTKNFYHILDFSPKMLSDLALSLDVIYHLVQDDVFDTYMNNLFSSSKKFVIIYSSNKNEHHATHVKHRKFTDWIDKNTEQWKLIHKIPNRYPFKKTNPNHTSFSDFYIFQKVFND